MTESAITVIGSVAAVLTTCAWLPQLVKTWTSRSAEDFSWAWLAMFSSGVTGWLLYGIGRRDLVIITANGVTVLLVLSIAVVKWQEAKQVGSRDEG
jgi:MtN3 and saliva related transmembrane protein